MSLASSFWVVSVDGLCVTWVDLVIACGGWREEVCGKFLGYNRGILGIGVNV